jgi:hypothetical protein
MSFTPTPEQRQVIDAFATGKPLVVEAGAGTGKTSTLKLCAAATANRRGVYIAYNKAIATDAAHSFPPSVTCRTAHSFAFQAVGKQYAARLKAPRQPAKETAKILRINEPIQLRKDLAPLAPQQLARIVTATIGRFCYSADDRIGRYHVPLLPGLDAEAERAELAKFVVPVAQRAWDQEVAPSAGRIRFTHDMYLKLWALSRPQFGVDFVFLDEAQDANPVIADLVERQGDTQRILVGDACQAIYGWRGATDAMRTFTGTRLYLSQSFRFGQAIADEANKWLSVLHARLRLRGFEQIRSTVGPVDSPDAILCRTNAAAVSQAAALSAAGKRAALVGGGDDIRRLAEAAIDLQSGRPTAHPELMAFTTWGEVQDYADHDSGGSDLQVAIKLIDKYTPDGVIEILRRLVDERYADVILSTAHKAKGREWRTVRIADDFREPKDDEDGRPGPVPREDAMLAYVAVTRAQRRLDREGLAWVDRHIGHVPALDLTDLDLDDEPADDSLFGCTAGPGDSLIAPICLRCHHDPGSCTCKIPPQRWSSNSGLTRDEFLARVREAREFLMASTS